MHIHRAQFVSLLHAQGDNTTADRVAAQLPAEIDTWRDADALAALGLPQSRLLAKLACGALGVSLKP